MERLKSLSAFFPAYNEEANVERMVNGFRGILPQVAEDYEIIVVDDGSVDGTRDILDPLRQERDIKVIFHEKNQGKGAAIRTGLQFAAGDVIVIQDADLEYDPGTI